MSLESAKKLLISNGYRRQVTDRIIATAGLHEGRLKEIAKYDANVREKNKLSKYLAIYPPAVVRNAIESGVTLDNHRKMGEILSKNHSVYQVVYDSPPDANNVHPDSCSKWMGPLNVALANSASCKSRSCGFTGQLEVYNAREFASPNENDYRLGGLGIVLYPSEADKQKLQKQGAHLEYNYEHMPGSLGFARFYVANSRLIITNLQSDLAKPAWHSSPKARDSIRKRYSQWDRYMLRAIEDMARNAGLKEVVMCTANHIHEKYGGMNPHNAYAEYAVLPQSEGFSLVETPKPLSIVGYHRAKNLFWVKPVKP